MRRRTGVVALETADVQEIGRAGVGAGLGLVAHVPLEGEPRQRSPVQAAYRVLGVVADPLAWRHGAAAVVGRVLAALGEDAPVGQDGEARQLPLDGVQGTVAFGEVEPRDAGEQASGIGVGGGGEHPRHRPFLDHLARVHHRHPVAEPGHHAEVVGDVEDGRSVALLETGDQIQDVRLGGHVEPGGGLVHDEQLRVAGEGHRDQHPLLLAAGKLMRVAQRRPCGIGQVDAGKKLAHPLRGTLASQFGVLAHHLADLVADPERRVERGLRVLIDHGDARALDGAQLARAEVQQVDVVEPDRARGDPPRRVEAAHHREREGALARAALADHRQGLAGAHREVDLAHRAHLLAAHEVRDREVPDGQDIAGRRRGVGHRRAGRPFIHPRSSGPPATRACRRPAG